MIRLKERVKISTKTRFQAEGDRTVEHHKMQANFKQTNEFSFQLRDNRFTVISNKLTI